MTQQERLRYLVEGLVAEYNERHNEHIEIPMNEKSNLLSLDLYVIFALLVECLLNG